jgi:uncharacterized protein (TIGR00730 family)
MKYKIFNEIEKIERFKKHINNGVSIFGSARIEEGSYYYNIAKELALTLTSNGFQVISGGGPGIMKAVIEGSMSGGSKSVGLNIKLPFEEGTLPEDKISIEFEYFMTRKLAFAKYSDAFVVMPGGMGTLDELFEILTLMQTKQMKRKKLVLYCSSFWGGLVEWLSNNLLENNLILNEDLNKIFLADSITETIQYLRDENDG